MCGGRILERGYPLEWLCDVTLFSLHNCAGPRPWAYCTYHPADGKISILGGLWAFFSELTRYVGSRKEERKKGQKYSVRVGMWLRAEEWSKRSSLRVVVAVRVLSRTSNANYDTQVLFPRHPLLRPSTFSPLPPPQSTPLLRPLFDS
jgi:hypothetical protein